ncbi:MAG: leucine-rich repeat-containing protein kinase family protein [Bacteroidetes bacterium]|nr:leucine-rich repeat-containing protein kinase family protein [Bacteroidota bacterium]
MHTLQQIQSGELKGIQRLQLSCGLSDFPVEIFSLADSLEILDLSGNKLSELPNDLHRLKKLKILFLANNEFTEFPSTLANIPSLTMIGFKSNKITKVPENAFPPHLRWLILTDNKIKQLPVSIGKCTKLQKCALAGNELEGLPEEMAACTNLELLRISANKIKVFPEWLLSLPRLSWIAYSGNPCSHQVSLKDELNEMDWQEFEIQHQLGEGASGFISKAHWSTQNKAVAVKVFKGAVTSDGLPEDEMNTCLAAGSHENLVKVLGRISNHPQQKQALVMELIPADYRNLGGPPSLETCSRDVFPSGTIFSLNDVLEIANGVASLCVHLHQRGIMHGDLYAHNTLVNDAAHALLGDFGAATFYDLHLQTAPFNERIEVRAFGCLLEDLLNHTKETNLDLFQLKEDCMQENVVNRPDFVEICERIRILKIKGNA